MTTRRFALALAPLLSFASLVACGGAERPPPAVGTTQITQAEVPARAPASAPQFERRYASAAMVDQDRVSATGAPLLEGQLTGDQWKQRYPFPAKALRDWAQRHPQTAKDLARWEEGDPEKARVFVQWASGHTYEPVGAFLSNRPGWDDFVVLRDRDPEAIDELAEWIRQGKNAANELVTYGSGFASATPH